MKYQYLLRSIRNRIARAAAAAAVLVMLPGLSDIQTVPAQDTAVPAVENMMREQENGGDEMTHTTQINMRFGET